MKRTVRDIIVAFVVTAAIVLALGAILIARSPAAVANPGHGCETVPRPILFNFIQKRTICDGPRRPDGSWERTRAIWTPAHTTNGYCSGSAYYVSCSPARYYDESVQEFERYVVFDHNVLQGEPPWLPPGTLVIR